MRDRRLVPLIIFIILLIGMNIGSIIQQGFLNWILTMLELLPGIIVGLSVHEFGHAYTSYKLGDPTPERQGRVTMNPMAHIDPFGFLCLLIAGFGWGIPVEIDPRYYKHPRRDEFLVSIAGVAMNFITAIVFTLLIKVLYLANPAFLYTSGGEVLVHVLQYVIYMNVVLMVFNLLPIPPLDGFGILTQIFDFRKYSWYEPLYQNGFFILMLLIIFNVTDFLLDPMISAVYHFLELLL